jgi:hypothetical protein
VAERAAGSRTSMPRRKPGSTPRSPASAADDSVGPGGLWT